MKNIPLACLPLMIIYAVSISGCANTSHVVVYQHSNFGLNAGMNPATQSIHVRLGMRNEFAIITPKLEYDTTVEKMDPSGNVTTVPAKGYHAASSYVATRFRVKDPFKAPEVAEIVATGKAATTVGEAIGSAAFLGE